MPRPTGPATSLGARMTSRPPLVSSIPFWALSAASVASIGVGAWILNDRLGIMSTALTEGTATGVEVYVGQSLAVVGAALVGAGVVGILLALAVAAAASLRPTAPVEIFDPLAEDDEIEEIDVVEVPSAPLAQAPVSEAPAADAPVSDEDRTITR